MGLAERNVRLVKQQLMKWAVERNGTSLEFWDQAIPSVMVILNNRYMTGVGTTPAMSMLGFEPFSKHEGVDGEVSLNGMENENQVLIRETNLWNADAREERRESIRTQKSTDDQDPTKPLRTFEVGNLVWEKLDKENKLKGKFHKSWGRLSKVMKKLSSVTYQVEPIEGGVQRKIHVDDLKIYIPRQERLQSPRLNTWDNANWDPETEKTEDMEVVE
ncbi:hypothetical protein E4U40_005484 [Claviceps sp. LM458 group G5]|nr:hypothetical protein E4U40_005484 [Claviceps sp. LM458 group G5]